MQWLSPEEFKEIYSKVPRLSIDIIIKTSQGILFTKRAIEPFRGTWHLPGGAVLFKESVEDAVKRVAKRELGIDVNPKTLLGYIEYPGELYEGKEMHSVALAFLVEPLSDKITLNYESDAHSFFGNIPKNVLPSQGKFLSEINIL